MATYTEIGRAHAFFCRECWQIPILREKGDSWFFHKEKNGSSKSKYFLLFCESQPTYKHEELTPDDDRSYAVFEAPTGKLRFVTYDHPVDASPAKTAHYEDRPECLEKALEDLLRNKICVGSSSEKKELAKV